ncbi:hypothetical protein BH09PAT4_BH09PAT4_05810 [soil metagenome]
MGGKQGSTGDPMPRIGTGELADMVQLGSLYREPTLANAEDLYTQARLAHQSAEDRGDPRVIEETAERLASILGAHPEFRDL